MHQNPLWHHKWQERIPEHKQETSLVLVANTNFRWRQFRTEHILSVGSVQTSAQTFCACWKVCSTSRCCGFSFWGPSCRFFPWFLLPPEVAPPAPLQTQDGSAVAKKKHGHNGCSLLCFGGFQLAADGAENKPLPLTVFTNINKRTKKPTTFIYATTIQQHQANEPTGSSSTPASTIGIQAGREGAQAQPCQLPPVPRCPLWGVLGTTAAIFFLCVRYILDMWKTRKKNGEREYIYTFVQKRHMN